MASRASVIRLTSAKFVMKFSLLAVKKRKIKVAAMSEQQMRTRKYE